VYVCDAAAKRPRDEDGRSQEGESERSNVVEDDAEQSKLARSIRV
jgi:hypothetical protein